MGSCSEWGPAWSRGTDKMTTARRAGTHTGRKESLCLTNSFRTADTTGFRLVKLSSVYFVSPLCTRPRPRKAKRQLAPAATTERQALANRGTPDCLTLWRSDWDCSHHKGSGTEAPGLGAEPMSVHART